LALFVAMQSISREPLLPLGIFRAPNLAPANILMALLGAAWIPLWFFLNLYLQQTLHLSALASGLALLPMTVLIMVLMVGATGQLVGRFGIKANLVVGLLALAGALLLLSNVPADGNYWTDVLPASLLAAAGMSLAYIPVTMAGMSGARPEETGLASGLINTTYQVGSAVGLAVMVALAASQREVVDAAGSSGLLAGFQLAFQGAAIVAGFAAVFALVALRSASAEREVPVG
jgi:MFS family permease